MKTKSIGSLVTGVALGLLCSMAHAVVTDEEFKLLGTTLTEWGAEKAGSPDGSYPAWSGDAKAPPGFDPASGIWPDLYPDEKPLFSIDAKNMAQYKDKLMEGQMELMRRYPTYRIDVYPTHRDVWFPDYWIKGALTNARNPECKTSPDGVGVYGCWNGTPFPIPRNGYEAMWNHALRSNKNAEYVSTGYLVNANGAITLLVQTLTYNEYPYNNPAVTPYEGAGQYYQRVHNLNRLPARDVGGQTMLWYPLQFDKMDQRAWSYTPGQRRVRLAPEFAYDTPSAQMGGTMFFDEISIFQGRMDRFKFELKGKQLMYLPYHNWRMHLVRGDPAQLLGPHHYKPEMVRHELRRVWVVEATPYPGVRHMASKKRFYLDEDTWAAIAYEGWDHSNKLFRVMFSNGAINYQNGGFLSFASSMQSYDVSRGQYTALQTQLAPGSYIRLDVPWWSEAELAPASMTQRGVR